MLEIGCTDLQHKERLLYGTSCCSSSVVSLKGRRNVRNDTKKPPLPTWFSPSVKLTNAERERETSNKEVCCLDIERLQL